jgi:phosphoribosylformylglycinamidine synthase I
MARVKTLLLRAPGTNCDRETDYAFRQAGAETSLVHIGRFIRGDERLADYQIMVIPGGFTYGDDLGAGRVMANELRLRLGEAVERFIQRGCLVMGICNGFQVLVKAGILPGGQYSRQITLTTNDSGRFECLWIHLKANKDSNCTFTRDIEHLYIPVNHGEGKLVAEPDILDHLNVVVQYCDDNDNPTMEYPNNPNGSLRSIAGICDETGRVFGLMPHPERFIHRTQHPRWTRQAAWATGDGLKIFRNAVDWIQGL